MYKYVFLVLLATSVYGKNANFHFDEPEPEPKPVPQPKPDHDAVCLACNDTLSLVGELIGYQNGNLSLEQFKEYVDVS